MAEVFISYASEDRQRVEPLARALERAGWSVWWDRIIPPGRTFDEVIEEELAAALCVIVVWTETSTASEWVFNEAADAHSRSILIPVLLDDVVIPLAFRRIQAADLTDWQPDTPHGEFDLLQVAIDRLAPRPQPHESAALERVGEQTVGSPADQKPPKSADAVTDDAEQRTSLARAESPHVPPGPDVPAEVVQAEAPGQEGSGEAGEESKEPPGTLPGEATATGSSPRIGGVGGGVLRAGSTGREVRALQEFLARRDIDPGPIDGIFGARTERAVRAFQKEIGIPSDGVVGRQTRDRIGLTLTGSTEQLPERESTSEEEAPPPLPGEMVLPGGGTVAPDEVEEAALKPVQSGSVDSDEIKPTRPGIRGLLSRAVLIWGVVAVVGVTSLLIVSLQGSGGSPTTVRPPGVPSGGLVAEPAEMFFGAVPLGSFVGDLVTVTNISDAPMTVRVAFESDFGTLDGWMVGTGYCNGYVVPFYQDEVAELGPGDQCAIEVGFQPITEGVYDVVFAIYSELTSLEVHLSGEGVA